MTELKSKPTSGRTRFSQAASALPPDSLVQYFRKNGAVEETEKGGNLRENSDNLPVRFIESGWVLRQRELKNGHVGVIGTYIPGDFIDMDCLVEDFPDDTLLALTPVKTLCVSCSALRDAIAVDGAMAFPIMTRMTAESDWLREGLAAVGQLPSMHRLMVYIWQMRRRALGFGVLEPGAQQMPFPLSQQQIASALGVSVVHANRTIRQLREGFGVTIRSGNIWFKDLAKLEAEMQRIAS